MRSGRDIVIGGDDAGGQAAYFATPASGRGPGVLLVHDDRGLGDFAREACDRLARAGFVALAPDCLDGDLPANGFDAEACGDRLDVTAAEAQLDNAIAELLNRDATDGGRVGTLGFGIGGALALRAATRNPRVAAAATFYGDHPRVRQDFTALAVPVFAVFAGDEASLASAKTLEDLLATAGVRSTVAVREGTRPGFMNDSLPDRHDAVAADAGWQGLTAFLGAELG
jgi:carboxymethylenebutenolidase